MKERFKKALKEAGYKMKEIASILNINYDALRKSIDRESINNGYLILLEYKTGISKEYILKGELPIIKSKESIILSFLEDDIVSLLDNIDKDIIISYISLREKEFQKIETFKYFIEKQKTTSILKGIAKKEQEER